MLAYYKLPPEILSYLETPINPFFPANFAQQKSFNTLDYKVCLKVQKETITELDKLVNIKKTFNKTLSRDLFRFYLKENSKITRNRIYASYHWGCLMKEKGYDVIAWNKNEVESIALSFSGVNIIWLENGYSRGDSYYIDSNFKINIKEEVSPINNKQLFKHQKKSIIYNFCDILFNLRDRFGSLGYYSQIFFKSIKKHNVKSIKNDNYLKVVFLGQLDYDYNTIICGNGFDFNSGLDYFNNMIKSLNKEGLKSKGYVRLHPNCSSYYKNILKGFPELKTDFSSSMNKCSNQYNLACTINSSASTSFINNFKQVIFLGSGEFVDNIKNKDLKNDFESIKLFNNNIASEVKTNLSNYIKKYHISKDSVRALILNEAY